MLTDYNKAPGMNPLRLHPACRLYATWAYEHLVEQFGVDAVYVLPADCGVIRPDFLTPYYDVTFSASAHGAERRWHPYSR